MAVLVRPEHSRKLLLDGDTRPEGGCLRSTSLLKRNPEIGKEKMVVLRLKQHVFQLATRPNKELLNTLRNACYAKCIARLLRNVTCHSEYEAVRRRLQ